MSKCQQIIWNNLIKLLINYVLFVIGTNNVIVVLTLFMTSKP